MAKTSTPVSRILALVFALTIMVSAIIPAQVSAAAPTWPTVQQSSSVVKEAYAMQYLINYWGYNTITTDGLFGSGTLAAVKNFQTKKGLTVDGVVGPNTWTALTNVTQKNGSNSDATRAIQYLLKNKYGFTSLAIDGSFGPGTESAVKTFQSWKGISSDGSVGPTTWLYLIGSPSETCPQTPTLSNERIIYNFLTGTMGLNKAAACGVLANIKAESNFNPNIIGDNGTSYGICQWHNSRWTALKQYRPNDWTTLNGQLYYLKYELEKDYPSVNSYLKSVANTATGAYNAGYYWCYYFEIPANREASSQTRGNSAKNTYWPAY